MIFPVWQPIGSSTHKIAEKIGNEYGEPATHTGTLDPMAEGVVVLLTGDDRYVKGSLHWPKTYQFSIVWGLQSDSGDKLGLIEKYEPLADATPLLHELPSICENFPEQYMQVIPQFSARRIQGSVSFTLALQGTNISEKKRAVSLNGLSLSSHEFLTPSSVLLAHHQAITKITGNFRQAEIHTSWKKNLNSYPYLLLITYHQVVTSPGTYIRQLVRDISEKVAIPATTWSITRIKNGPFDQHDCVEK